MSKNSRYSLLLPLFFLLLPLSGCKTEADIFGPEVLDPTQRYPLFRDTLKSMTAHTVADKPLRLFNFETFTVGAVEDEQFGKSRMAVVTQLQPQTYQVIGYSGSTPFTRCVFRLRVREHYGKGNVKVNLHRLKEPITRELTDRPVSSFDTCELLGSQVVNAESDVIEIPLAESFGHELLLLLLSNSFAQEPFLLAFPGLVITAVTDGADGGQLLTFNRKDVGTGLVLNWNSPISGNPQEYVLEIGNESLRYQAAEHDAEGSALSTLLQQDATTQMEAGLGYLEGAGGTGIEIDFSELLAQLRAQFPLAIHRALLEIPIAPNSPKGGDTATHRLTCYIRDSDGAETPVLDAQISEDLYGGFPNRGKGLYYINITYYLQQLLLDRDFPHRVVIRPYEQTAGSTRMLLGLPTHEKTPMRLVLTYSLL